VESIGSVAHFIVKDGEGNTACDTRLPAVHDARDALATVEEWLRKHYSSQATLLGVGHRVVHGGRHYAAPTLITEQGLADLRALIPLAPLHQPHNLAAIEAIHERAPGVPQVACFDTSFHRGLPAVAELIALPADIRSRGVQRYGFHGLSYEYIAEALPQVAPEIADGRVIVAHLGSGASLCALKERKSLDCTLSFTALDGLCMGTRPGSVDPGVILYLFQTLGLSASEVERILYTKSGLLGISGVSSDMRDLLASEAPEAKLAIDYFVYSATKQIGALAAVLGGVEGLVFTAGIGERSAEIRARICAQAAWLGLELDPRANQEHGPRISTAASRVSAWVVPTNEELMIARHTGRVLGLTAA
jgi:acetate kinase